MKHRSILILTALVPLGAAYGFGPDDAPCPRLGPPPAGEFGPPGRPSPPGPPEPALFDLDRLDLDDSTRAQMDAIRVEADEATEAMHERIRDGLERLHSLMEEEPFDRDAIIEHAEVVEDLRKDAHLLRLDAVLQVRALLTPEQREELRGMREELLPGPPARRGPPHQWRHMRGI